MINDHDGPGEDEGEAMQSQFEKGCKDMA